MEKQLPLERPANKMQRKEFQPFLNWCKICPHLNEVEDVREGNRVCTDCGLILDCVYSSSLLPATEKIINEINVVHGNTEKIIQEEEENLITLCDKLHLSSDIKTEVNKIWQEVKKWYVELKNHRGINLREGLIVMVVYLSLLNKDVPRPVSHLCQEAGMKEKMAWKWINWYSSYAKFDGKIVNPVDMCEYFLQPLRLHYKDVREIKSNVAKYYEALTFSPKTIIAACAYLFLNKINSRYTVKKIATELGVSHMAVYRCKEAITKKKNE